MVLRDYASRISLGKAVTGSETPLPLLSGISYSLANEMWTAIGSLWPFTAGVAFKLHPSGVLPSRLPVPIHTALDEPGTSSPELLGAPLEPEELEHWGHIGAVPVPHDQSSYPQTFLRCLPNVPLKAASIATLFSCCRLKRHYLFCPYWAENIAYHTATLPVCHGF